DALGPLLPPWLRALGADVVDVRRVGDDEAALHTPPLPRSRERRQRKLVTCLLTGRHGNSPAAHGR
ncbi:hypothetical protein ABZW57_11150, partial [Streptomyces pseudogriseolus]